MNKNLRVLGIAVVGLVALLLPLKANAACGSISFGSYYSLLTNTSGGPSLRSSFWMMGNGSPTIGAGNDNGAIADNAGAVSNWVLPNYASTTNPALLGNWGSFLFDGCADAAGGTAVQRMAFGFSDVDVSGNTVFAGICVHRDPTAGVQFDTTMPAPGTASPTPIALVPVPKATITNTVRAGSEASVTVASPNFAPGFYTDGSTGCDLASVIPQYDVYQQQVTRNTAPSATRDAGASWVLVGTGNTGSPFTFSTACGAVNCDVFVAVAPHFNSGFSTGEPATASPNRVGLNSTKVQAGPTLAVTPKAKPIENKKIAE
jgi:hypothetical protein